MAELWRAVRKRVWIVVAVAAIATLGAGAVARWYLPRLYAATATLMVIPPASGPSAIDTMVTGQQMVTTYTTLASNATVVAKAALTVPGSPPPAALAQNIAATPEAGTNLLTVTVTSRHPRQAAQLTNAISHVLVSTVARITGQPTLKLVTPATPNATPVSPQLKRTLGLAFLLGLLGGVLLVWLMNALDDRVQREEEMATVLECPVLGVISTIPARTAERVRSETPSPSVRRNQRSASS